MHVISQKTLKELWRKHPDAETPLRAWWTVMRAARYGSPHEVREAFSGAVDFIGRGRAVFNIGGNKHRLIADFRYHWGRVYVVAVLTLEEYDRVTVTQL